MSPAFEDSRRWMARGGELFVAAVTAEGFDLDAPSLLPGWSRRHVIAHIAANAEALSNLVHWAATGIETPMYASVEARLAGIEEGRKLPADELIAWVDAATEKLDSGMAALTDSQWQTPVVTAQGRTVAATELPWLRSREVNVHTVDLAAGIGFDELTAGFCAALSDDIVAKRSAAPGPAVTLATTDSAHTWTLPGVGEGARVEGSVGELAAYLAGRPSSAHTPDGAALPVLPPWI